MKRICLLLAAWILSGCAENSTLLKRESVSIRSDVFQESSNAVLPEGYAELRIVSSLKTHLPGIYPFEKKIHGTPDYRLLVNIDGQAIQLQGDLQHEGSEIRGPGDPEAGDGIRYRFSKNLRLKAGPHKIIVAIPEDGVAIEREIILPGRSKSSLVVGPIYGAVASKQRPGFIGRTSFKEGLKRFRLTLNGHDV